MSLFQLAWRAARAFVLAAGFVAAFVAPRLAAQTISTFATGLNFPAAVAIDSAGNVYVGENSGQIRKYTPAGVSSVLATGLGPNLYGLAFDSANNLYVSSYAGGIIRKVTPAGGVTTFATVPTGNIGMAVDSANNVYVACRNSPSVIAKITPAGAVSTFVTLPSAPVGLASDGANNLYVGYTSNYISKVTPAGVISTFATGFLGIYGLAVTGSGEVYAADYGGSAFWRISPAGVATQIATGLSGPWGVAQRDGLVYFAERNSGELNRFGLGIGVNFTGNAFSLTATDMPGIVGGGNWNNIANGSGSNVVLADSSGTATTAQLAFSSTGAYGGFSALATPNAATNTMRRGGLYGGAGGEASFTVSNIPYTFYDVYVYASGDNADTSTLSLTGGGATYYYRSNGQNDAGATSQQEVTSTNAASPTVGRAFYQVFRNRSGSTFTATTGGSISGSISNNIFGFQIVPVVPPPAPVISSPTSATANVGAAFSYQITASNSPTSFGAAPLPAGLTFNSASGLISGTPTANGTFTIGISATNPGGTGSASLTLTVNGLPAPVITSPGSVPGAVGTNLNYQITATNSPTSFSSAPLPANLSLNTISGFISGVPAAAGSQTVGISATNSGGTGNGSVTFNIAKGAATVTLGSLTHTYDGAPKSATASTTPPGLAVGFTYAGSATAPANAGSYALVGTISDANYNGSASGTFTINPAAATVTLANLTQGYDGAPKSAAVTTTPGGLATSVTYNGSAAAPSAIGNYTVNATVTDANYTGSASGTLRITDTIRPVLTLPSSPIVVEATSAAGAVVNFTATANDNVDGVLPVSLTPASGTTFALGNTTVNASATDAAGNTATGSFVVTVRDTTAPTIAPVAQIVAEATSPAGAVVTFGTSASDGVSGAVSVTATPASGSTFAFGATPVTLTATDAAGNSATATFNVVVRDTTKPVLALPADFALEATGPAGATATFAATATDAGGFLLASSTFETPAYGANSHNYATFNGTAVSGGWTFTGYGGFLNGSSGFGPLASAQGQQHGFVQSYQGTLSSIETENAFPVIAGATYVVSFQQASRPGSGSYGGVTYAVTLNGPGGSTELFRRTTATGEGWARYTATFVATTTGSFRLAFNTLVAGSDSTFFVDDVRLVGTATPVATSPASGSTFALGATSVSASITDAAGNSESGAFTITVRDTTAPTIATPANIVAEATSASGAAVSFNATASDLVSGNVAVSATPASGSTFALGTTTVQLRAVDAAGNERLSSFTVTVRDTTAPTITTPANIVAEATSASGAAVSFNATASDLVSGNVAVSATPVSGATFPLGTTTVQLRAVDAAGNESLSSFTVTVRDTTAPVLALPASQTLEATSAAGAVASFTVTATDNVGATVTTSASSGSTFAVGTTIVTATATDAAGNSSSGTFTITVRDTTAPAITAPANTTAEATSAAGATVTFTATATDIVDGAVSVTAMPVSGSTFAIGATTVSLTARDAAGNESTASFTVTVQDTTAPVLTTPASQTLEATSAAGAVATFAASATDAVGATIEYSHASGATFGLGATSVTVTARDAAGNSTSGTFTVTVSDTTAPALTLPASFTLEASSAAGATATFAASANDIVSGSVTVTLSAASGGAFPLGATTVNASATDAAGNTATGSFTITVRDTTAPAVTPPADIVAEATSAAGASVTFAATATDAVTASPTIGYTPAPGSTFGLGTTTVAVTARDAANNSSSANFTVTVQDTTAPALTVPANLIVEATSGAGAVVNFSASATDVVTAAPVITFSQNPGTTFALGTTTVTVTARDGANNVTTRSFTVTVRDVTAPTFSALTASSTSLWPANHKMVAITLTATASDTVSAVTTRIVSATSNEPDNGLGDGDTTGDIQITGAMTLNLRAERAGGGNGRIYTITVEARDAANNVSTRTVTVTVPKNQSGR